MSDRERDAALLERERIDLVGRLRLRLPEALDAALSYMLSGIAGSAGQLGARNVAGWREAVDACLECGLVAIEHGRGWAGSVPEVALAQARRAARNGVELAVVLARYRAAYEVAWEIVVEEIAAGKMSERHGRIVLCEASAAAAALLARLLVEVTEVHAEELGRAAWGPARHREELVRRVLVGRRVDRKELDYDLDGEHLAVIATGAGAARALEILAQRAGRRLLLLEQGDGTVSGWLGGTTRLLPTALVSRVPTGAHADVAFAVGPPARGLRGFRRTYRLAQAALLVARRWPQRTTLYDEVEREAHALQDEDYAMSLIETYIVPLEGGRDGAMLRRTLKALYDAKRNEEKAARVLSVHRHTVARRLLHIEELIGRPLDRCHAQIELALRLADLHDGPGGDTEPPRT